MPTKVIVADRVLEYQRAQAPLPRRRIKAGIVALAEGAGDIKALHGNLEGLCRLRIGEHRLVYRHRGGRIEIFYAAPRKIVYEYLASHIRELTE